MSGHRDFAMRKMSVADDCMATCGTINLDYRSLYHHFENGCFIVDNPAVLSIPHAIWRRLLQEQEGSDRKILFRTERVLCVWDIIHAVICRTVVRSILQKFIEFCFHLFFLFNLRMVDDRASGNHHIYVAERTQIIQRILRSDNQIGCFPLFQSIP